MTGYKSAWKKKSLKLIFSKNQKFSKNRKIFGKKKMNGKLISSMPNSWKRPKKISQVFESELRGLSPLQPGRINLKHFPSVNLENPSDHQNSSRPRKLTDEHPPTSVHRNLRTPTTHSPVIFSSFFRTPARAHQTEKILAALLQRENLKCSALAEPSSAAAWSTTRPCTAVSL